MANYIDCNELKSCLQFSYNNVSLVSKTDPDFSCCSLSLGLVPLHRSWVIAACVDVIRPVTVQVRGMDDSPALLPLPNANPVFIRACKQLGVIRSGDSSYSWEISSACAAGVKQPWQHTWSCNRLKLPLWGLKLKDGFLEQFGNTTVVIKRRTTD